MRVQLRFTIAMLALMAAGVFALATEGTKKKLAQDAPETKTEGKLNVESPAFKEGAPIPAQYSQIGKNLSPALKWSGAPKEAKSFAVVLEDPDAPMAVPFIHWILYNIPGDVTELPEGLPRQARLEKPAGALQGVGQTRRPGYMGPRPPKGNPPHHYHFQVFALDNTLELKPGAPLAELLKAMNGHVVAKGETVGTFQIAE